MALIDRRSLGGTSGSGRLFPWHPVRALRSRLHDITNIATETRGHVVESRDALAARLDALAGMLEDLAAAQHRDRVWLRERLGVVADGAREPPDFSPASDGVKAPVSPPPEWEFVADAWAGAQSERPGWDVQSVAKMYAERWPAFLDGLHGSDPLGATHVVPIGVSLPREDLTSHNMVMVFAYALALSAWRSNRISILDWGGALGHYHALARALMPDLELDYHCKELPAVCAQGKQVSPEVTFHENDACLERSYDLVIASGAIQYSERWSELLARLAGSARHYLLITKVPVTEVQSFVVLQRAYDYGYDTEYLGWALNRGQVREAGEAAGMKLLREFFLSATLEVPDAPGSIHHRGFLFKASRSGTT